MAKRGSLQAVSWTAEVADIEQSCQEKKLNQKATIKHQLQQLKATSIIVVQGQEQNQLGFTTSDSILNQYKLCKNTPEIVKISSGRMYNAVRN